MMIIKSQPWGPTETPQEIAIRPNFAGLMKGNQWVFIVPSLGGVGVGVPLGSHVFHILVGEKPGPQNEQKNNKKRPESQTTK